MNRPDKKPDSFCLAPWVHTYISPQTERRMCCASREPAQNFKQYIDIKGGTGKYIPITLGEHWNSEHMKDVRRRMMSGEQLPECEVCNDKMLNTNVYRNYFWGMFNQHYNQVWEQTLPDGTTTFKPISWDYRFSNLCNFKCRMCGDMLSSSWESENRIKEQINWDDQNNNWLIPSIKKQIDKFQDSIVEQEFAQAVEEHRVEEVYWVGGEPLMYHQHWKYMKRIIELGDGKKVYARYNTNLSQVDKNNINLFTDILVHLRDWQICASIDGTGYIGEYIRTGLKYNEWLNNFKQGLAIQTHIRQMRLDFTLTLPGMFEVVNIVKLAKDLNVQILAKMVLNFTPDIMMSPLILPRPTLNKWIDDILKEVESINCPQHLCQSIIDLLLHLKTYPTNDEKWNNKYVDGCKKGKKRILQLEEFRQNYVTMDDILRGRSDVYKWWQKI